MAEVGEQREETPAKPSSTYFVIFESIFLKRQVIDKKYIAMSLVYV